MNILFTICGRAGSKGFNNKNLKKLNGIPLVYYTLSVINLYQETHKEDNIVVALNTDSQELISLIKQQRIVKNVQIVERKEDLAGDSAPKAAVIQSTYQQCKSLMTFDVVVDLDITSPMRRLCDVENAINEFLSDSEYDLVFSVVPARRSPYFNMVEKRGKYYNKICESNYTARQQAPVVYELNASIYAYSPRFLEAKIEKTILEYNCGIIEMPDYLVLDIDSEEDFVLLESLLPIFCEKDKGLKAIKAAIMMNERG